MAVNYANALDKRIDASFLCCTRMEGLLKTQLKPEVGYLFLNKKSTLDLKAFFKLRKFVNQNKISLIQAHSSSWFLALCIKISLRGVKLVWHDHYGKDLNERKSEALKIASGSFDGIFSVNRNLKKWSQENLKCENIQFNPNFLPTKEDDEVQDLSPLLGSCDDFKIICVANLRPQKDHLNLLEAFQILLQKKDLLSLHLIGKDFSDDYSQSVKRFISDHGLEKNVFLYGEQKNVEKYLYKADLGILSSVSEGLPVSLLEYGRAGLPVVCTNVGECPSVVGNHGKIVPPKNPPALAEAVLHYLLNERLLLQDARNFKRTVERNYSEEVIFPQILQQYTFIKS